MKKCVISNLGTIVTGKTPSTKNENYWGNEIPFVTPKDIQSSKHIFNTERYLTTNGANSVKGCILPPKSICVSCIGNIGYTSMTIDRAVSNQQINSIIVNNEHDIDFVYYLMKSLWSYFKNYEGQSTTVSILNKSQFSKIEILIPDNINIERKIAAILSSLDNKIELNQRVNNNLEQQAQALFKSWFVDFEPFGGKMPDDWKIYKLGDFLPVITGKKNANVSSSEGKYPFFSCSQDIAWTDSYSFEGNAILVAGNGDFNIKFYNGKFEAYQRTYVLIPYKQRYTDWLYYAVKHNLSTITSNARGSVISFITKGNLENFEFAAPSNLENFNIVDVFLTINKCILQNKRENEKLVTLRDALLPKLMSGEIDVSKVNISADKLSFNEE